MQMDKEITKVHSEGISWPHARVAGRAEAEQSVEFKTLYAAMAVGWELDGWELSTCNYLQSDRALVPSGDRISKPPGREGPPSCRITRTTKGEDMRNK